MNTLKHISTIIQMTLLVGILSLPAHQGMGQGKMEMTLNEALRLAQENNWQVRKAEQNVGIATVAHKQSLAVFLPSINLSENYVTTTDPLMSFGLKLKQEIATTADFNPMVLNDPSRIENYATIIKVEQPIFNPDGIMAKKAAKKGVQAAEHAMEWTKSMTAFQVKKLYFDLQLANEQQSTMLSALEAGKANKTVATDLFDQDLINKADLLAASLRVTELESQVMLAENYLSNLNLSLAHALGLGQEVILVPTDSIPLNIFVADDLSSGMISEERNDLKALRMQVEASNLMLKSSKGTFLPKFNMFGSYELNDQKTFGGNASNYLIGARLEWDIFKGGMNIGKIQKASHQKKLVEITYQEKLSDSNRALKQIQNGLELAKKQIELSELAYEQAKEVYRVRKDRFAEGMEKTSDLLQAESELLSKKLNNLQQVNRYQQLVFNLEILLEKDLTNKI